MLLAPSFASAARIWHNAYVLGPCANVAGSASLFQPTREYSFPVGIEVPGFSFLENHTMNLKETARTWLQSILRNHIASNVRNFTWASYFGDTQHNSLGGINYLSNQEGKVVDANDQFTLVKTKPTSFVVVLTSLLSQPVNIGDKIGMSFYKLKRFDGTAADGQEDPSDGFSRLIMLTGAKTFFPVKWEGRYLGINERFSESYQEIRNPYLQDMIQQMEDIPVNGGLRRVVNIMTDANPTNLSFNDPLEEDSAVDAPAIKVHVDTAKHKGQVEISYNRCMDTYSIKLTQDAGSQPLEMDNIHFNQLGEALIDGIDDGEWLKAKVTVIKAAPKKRTAAAAA